MLALYPGPFSRIAHEKGPGYKASLHVYCRSSVDIAYNYIGLIRLWLCTCVSGQYHYWACWVWLCHSRFNQGHKIMTTHLNPVS